LEGRFVAEQDAERLEPRNLAADRGQAHRDRRREQEADGPQSHVQKSADTRSASADTPVRCPITRGSTTLAVSRSTARKKPMVANMRPQPSNCTAASAAGITSASGAPR